MKDYALERTINVLKILLKIDNVEIMKCTIESLIEELEELQKKKQLKPKIKD